MADSERKLSNHVSSGFVDGTGVLLPVVCGFRPKSVFIINADGLVRAHWDDLMDSDSMVKVVDADVAGSIVVTPHADSGGAISITPHADSAGTPAPLNLASPAFDGTGFVTSSQVITTTDNQTMSAVDSAAGMWFIADALTSSPPVLIASNTVVAGAPAVLTCIGVPPVTDGGTYKIVGSSPLASHSHASTAALDSTHSHASTAAFTGSGGGMSVVSSDGIIPMFNGFSIGVDADLNVSGEDIYWVAIK